MAAGGAAGSGDSVPDEYENVVNLITARPNATVEELLPNVPKEKIKKPVAPGEIRETKVGEKFLKISKNFPGG